MFNYQGGYSQWNPTWLARGSVSFPEQESYIFEEFSNIKIQWKYTIGNDVFEYMGTNPEMHVVIDAKGDTYLDVIQKIVDEADDDVLSRFIIQCYKPGDKELVSNMYDFPEENYLFTAYKYSDNPYMILKVCMDENFNVVTLPFEPEFYEEDSIELFTSKNIRVYFHTINRVDIADFLTARGAHGMYTDFLIQSFANER